MKYIIIPIYRLIFVLVLMPIILSGDILVFLWDFKSKIRSPFTAGITTTKGDYKNVYNYIINRKIK